MDTTDLSGQEGLDIWSRETNRNRVLSATSRVQIRYIRLSNRWVSTDRYGRSKSLRFKDRLARLIKLNRKIWSDVEHPRIGHIPTRRERSQQVGTG